MLKKLKTGLICLIIGEIISWIVSFVTLPSFIHGFLLGLSVGLKLISIIFIFIIIISHPNESKQ